MLRQFFQLSRVGLADDIRTGGKNLSQFDKSRSQGLKGLPQTGGTGRRIRRTGLSEKILEEGIFLFRKTGGSRNNINPRLISKLTPEKKPSWRIASVFDVRKSRKATQDVAAAANSGDRIRCSERKELPSVIAP